MLETLGLRILVKASTKLLPMVKENEDSMLRLSVTIQ